MTVVVRLIHPNECISESLEQRDRRAGIDCRLFYFCGRDGFKSPDPLLVRKHVVNYIYLILLILDCEVKNGGLPDWGLPILNSYSESN